MWSLDHLGVTKQFLICSQNIARIVNWFKKDAVANALLIYISQSLQCK